METSSKSNKTGRRFVAFLTASATLAIATLVSASTSTQVKELSPLVVPRTAHAATALTDGRILITGGRDSSGNIVAVSEIFDPATETSTAGATLTTPRVDHTATLLADGRVLVAGGNDGNGPVNSAEIFDGSGFHVLPTMGAARARHTATLLNSGQVLIAGGDDAGTAEIFDPATESFSSALLAMAAPRIGHTATLFSDDTVLFAGGNTNSMELFTPNDQKFTLDSQVMSAARTGHEAIELSATRLLFFEGDTGNTIDEFNHSADTLALKGTMGASASSATLLANGKILVLGPGAAGLYSPDATDPSSAFTAFDETSVPGSTALRRSGQTATELSGDKRILVAGGVNAQNLSVNPALFNAARIWTDKDDYVPGDNVILSGSGWKANENVYLYAVDDTTEAWTYGSTVTADANGGFVVDPYFIVQLVQLGANFHVTAVGAQSAMQADVKFTDSVGSATITTVNGTPKANFGPPTNFQITYTSLPQSVTVAFTYSTSATGTTSGTLDLVGTTVTASKSLTTGVGPLSDSITINIPPGTPNGTYNLKVTVTNNAGSGSNQKNDQVGQAIVINVPTIAPTTLTVSPASGTYGGTASLSATLTKTSDSSAVSGKTISFTVDGNPVGTGTTDATGAASAGPISLCGSSYNAGSHTIAASFAGDSSYAGSNGSNSLAVGKANATVVVTPYNVPYDTNPHTATYTITGVCSETGAAVGTIDVSNTTHTNAGTYNTDSWSFTGTGNYNNIAATMITDIITKVTPTATLTVTNSPQTYNCSGQAATVGVSASSVPGTAQNIVTGGAATQMNAGSYGVTADFVPNDMTNYNTLTGLSAGNFVIKQAKATINVTPYTSATTTYDCTDHTATGAATGVCSDDLSSLLDLSGTKHKDAGDYPSDSWTFAGNANYESDSGTVHDSIAKAKADITVTPYTTADTTYDCNPHTATGTAMGLSCDGDLSSLLHLSGTTHTNAGDYPGDSWTFDGNNNYESASGTVDDSIAKAHLTVTADNKTKIYDTAVYSPFTATITGFLCGDTVAVVSGSPTFTGTAVGAFLPGTYTITPEVGTLSAANYDFTPLVNGTLTITFGTCSGSQMGGVILPPINSDGSSVYPRKKGSTIPVKFTVCDANGNPISDPAAVFGPNPVGASITLVGAVRGTVDNINELGDTIDVVSNAFRYSDGQWIFNMATINLTAGTTYTFKINLAYGSIIFKVGVK
jgi:MBG domain (YGX type)/Bacterial Ig-like domain (group 3)/Galactose oxidase, central domain